MVIKISLFSKTAILLDRTFQKLFFYYKREKIQGRKSTTEECHRGFCVDVGRNFQGKGKLKKVPFLIKSLSTFGPRIRRTEGIKCNDFPFTSTFNVQLKYYNVCLSIGQSPHRVFWSGETDSNRYLR